MMDPLPPLDQEELQTAVHAALSDWTRAAAQVQGKALAHHLLLVREKAANADGGLSERQAVYAVLEEGLQRLEEQDETGAHVLRYRFYDGEITRQVAARLHSSPDQVNRWQRTAIENLTAILLAAEMKRREELSYIALQDLPSAPYTRLFGLQALEAEITGQLMRPEEPLLVALSGIGGIGKTSLADAVARLVAPTLAFERIIWLRATYEPFAVNGLAGANGPAERSWARIEADLNEALFADAAAAESQEALRRRLADLLHSRPVLICLDNLEHEDQTVYYLEQARRLAGPSKFLITTRARPTVSAPAYFRSVEELPLADAADLLRYQARVTGTGELAEASDDDIAVIYEVTGGNPLALRLVAGQAAVMPLHEILNGLQKSRPGPIEDMYRAIFWEAWRALTEDAQSLLQAMPLVADTGGLPEQLQVISGLSEERLWTAVRELFARSLLEVRGTVHERRYSIHHLTETFLRTEIVGWDAGEQGT